MTKAYSAGFEPVSTRKLKALGLGLALVIAAACANTVKDDTPTSAGGSGGSTAAGGAGGAASGGAGGAAGGGASPVTGDTIAITLAQLDALSSSSSGSSSTSSGSVSDPDTLFIMLSNMSLSCADPYDKACGQWDVSIRIPPELQNPGLIDLANPDVSVYLSELGADCQSGSSGSSGGSGTLELIVINDAQVTGTIAGTSFYNIDVNGSFTAARCP